MVWFKVDDSFHSHPKVLSSSLGAVGLWTVAGSWSSDHHTDGYVPDYVIPQLSRGATDLADELVAARLWRRTKGGYQFHQWNEDGDGSVRNPTRSEVMARRSNQSSGGEIGNHRRWHVAKGVVKPGCPYCQQEQYRSTDRLADQRPEDGTESHPNPPVPSRPGPSSGSFGRGSPGSNVRAKNTPPQRSRCEQHAGLNDDDPGPNCRDCRDARVADERNVEAIERAKRHSIRACSLCDGDGWRWVNPARRALGLRSGPDARCDHQPERVST